MAEINIEKEAKIVAKRVVQDLRDNGVFIGRWIPVTERLPDDLEAVNITWVNHEPEPYYHDIKDRNFTATGIHYKGKWYWYSTTCADYLGEYGSNEVDEVDSAIEIVAWMPLPESYKAESKLDGDPIDIDKAVEHYEGTLETLKGIDLEVDA